MRRQRIDIPSDVITTLRSGAVIPAHPLALDARRCFDRRRQRALTRYYLDAGAGGLAVGVHTTRSPTATARSTAPSTRSGVASLGVTRSCVVRASWKALGASTPARS